MSEGTTRDRMIEAAIKLVNEKGYKGATTKMIAERAGVNEVTLFRHFGSKKGLVEAAIDKYSFADHVSETLETKVMWDINKDLPMLVKEYQELLEQKREIILISLKEAGAFPELDRMIARVPETYKKKLMDYFDQMMQQGKIRRTDAEILATNFIFLNFGYFLLKSRLHSVAEDMSVDDFIHQNIASFIHSII